MEEMTFKKAVITCFKKFCVFKGRARRSEFWYWTLFTFLVSIGFSALKGLVSIFTLNKGTGSTNVDTVFVIITIGWTLATLLPTLGVSVRRLHDTDHSGWWLLAAYILEIVGLVLVMGSMVPALLSGSTPDLANMSGITTVIGGIILLASFALLIVLLVFYIKDGFPGTNPYGPNPKEILLEPGEDIFDDTPSETEE